MIETENKQNGRSYVYLTTMKQHWYIFLDDTTFRGSFRLKVIGWTYGVYHLIFFRDSERLLHDSQYTTLRRRIGTKTMEELEEICQYITRKEKS